MIVGHVLEQQYDKEIEDVKHYEDDDADIMARLFINKHLVEKEYEKRKAQIAYFVFKIKRGWWIIDIFALYLHIPINLFILCIAVFYRVNLFYFCNILAMTTFYISSSLSLHKQTKEIEFKHSNIDLEDAYNRSKKFNQMASDIFMQKRAKIWLIQFILIMTVIVLEFPLNALDDIIPSTDSSVTSE